MRHPTNTHIIFADSAEEARAQYQAIQRPTRDPHPVLECFKVLDVEDFDINASFNFVGEISVGPQVMDIIRQDPERAYVLYYMEDVHVA
ncbi:MAG: hypothetical protein ACOY81_03200 [Bacillota bacterium]|uniref:hypothetical protein n=1 Tax=Desulfurispora thermophila TaxID=265470 RepID=UPI0003797EE0|nr:hypothetical protein [Desulfurispora thermophila]